MCADELYDFPATPVDKAEVDVEYALKDMLTSAKFLHKKSLDPVAEPFVLREEARLWEIKFKIDELITFIRTKNGDPLPTTATFKPKLVHNA